MSFSPAQALSFAPDAATARKGEDLATIRKWRNVAGNPEATLRKNLISRSDYFPASIAVWQDGHVF